MRRGWWRSAPGCRGRRGSRTRPGRPGTGSRASSRRGGVECVVAAPGKIERRGRDGSRPIIATPSGCVRLLMIDELHAVRVPGAEEEALRDLVRAREDVRGGSDARPPPALEAAAAPRDPVRGRAARGPSVTATGWRRSTLELAGAQATLLDYQGAIDALVHRREQLEREIVASCCPLALGGAGRPVAVPARGRHAHRGRAVRRDRRLRALRPRRAADELRRAGPVASATTGAAAAGSGRSPRPGPGTPGGCWSRRRGTSAPRGALLYPRRSRDELEGRFVGLMAYPDPRGERNNRMPAKRRSAQVSGPGCRGTRVIWRKLDCLNPNLQMTQRLVRRKDTRYRRHALRRLGSAAVATFGAWSVAQ